MQKQFNRYDDDNHKYQIPDEMLDWYDTCIDLVRGTKHLSDEWYDAVARFNYYFEPYMVG